MPESQPAHSAVAFSQCSDFPKKDKVQDTDVKRSCRYSSKEALTEIHQHSAPFKKFKEQWTAAKLEYTSKTGESYLEEDLGFM